MRIQTILASALALMTAGTIASAQEKNITLYTPNPEQAIQTVADTLHSKHPDIRLNSVSGGSGVLLRRIQAESANPQGDIFWSSSYNTVRGFAGYFDAYQSPELAAIFDNIRYPDHHFAPVNVHVVVMMINKDQLGTLQAPATWNDLLDPKWKGKIIVANPANSSTGYTILWGIYKKLGANGLKKLAENVVISSSSTAVQSGISMGEYPVGLAFEANAYPYVAGGQKEIQLIYPQDGTFITAEYAGLLKNAPAHDAARQTFDTLLSKDTQTELLKTAFRRPSRKDIEVSKYTDLPEMSAIPIFPINEQEAADQRQEFLKIWQADITSARQ